MSLVGLTCAIIPCRFNVNTNAKAIIIKILPTLQLFCRTPSITTIKIIATTNAYIAPRENVRNNITLIIKKHNSKILEHKKPEPVVVSTTGTDEEPVLKYRAESACPVVKTTPREGFRSKILLLCFSINSHALTKAGASSKFPINCGSIANPFGCGNPNILYVHPAHIKLTSRDTPAKSNTHCKKHHPPANSAEPKNTFQNFSLNPTSLNKLLRLQKAYSAKYISHNIPAVKTPLKKFIDHSTDNVTKIGNNNHTHFRPNLRNNILFLSIIKRATVSNITSQISGKESSKFIVPLLPKLIIG